MLLKRQLILRAGLQPTVTRQPFKHVETFGFDSDNYLELYKNIITYILSLSVLFASAHFCHMIVICLERGGVGFVPFFEFRVFFPCPLNVPWCLASVCNEFGSTAQFRRHLQVRVFEQESHSE